MARHIEHTIEEALKSDVKNRYGVDVEPATSTPPQKEMGDLAFTLAFDLARVARKAPKKIAEELADPLRSLAGVGRVEIAGAGYLNVFLDRHLYMEGFCTEPDPPARPGSKVIVEHTNINPNKAAHIGHLRNAALGDTFVRALRYCGETVEVQNYIDDTGVQVADVVAGFLDLERKDLAAIQMMDGRFDYYCWDLYARVTEQYAADPARQARRQEILKAIEDGAAPEAPVADYIATRIARAHLETMERVGARYDVLPREGDILRLRFWDYAFELLKERKAIRLAQEGKNNGCWVMDLAEEPSARRPLGVGPQRPIQEKSGGGAADAEKVIVRSNGTVTYVGKDIAYQLWKLGELPRDFHFKRFHRYADGTAVWSTTSENGEPDAPRFGAGARVYNVIDSRQAYLQHVVQEGVARVVSAEARARSRHFSYEMVALTPETCRALGFPVSEEDAKKPYLEVSGRKGLGVKADDLMNALEERAREEVEKRNPEFPDGEKKEMARRIAQGALRYFMVKFTKNKVIAFDFQEALSFEGDSGPYLQYATVRAKNIFQKLGLPIPDPHGAPGIPADASDWSVLPPDEANAIWDVLHHASRLPDVADEVRRAEEPAILGRWALELSQKFNTFYHRYRIKDEPDAKKRAFRLLAAQVFYRQMCRGLDLMGIPVPERM